MLQLVTGGQGGAAKHRPPYFRTKKLGLLGSTESLRFAPWFDPSWTLAAHPCCRPSCKREPDWYFDLHRKECFTREQKSWNPAYYTWLKRLQTPIFMQERWPEIPAAVKYPLDLVEAEFASTATGELYATNHCAFMIALAMMEGVTHIGLFGCQYGAATEHSVQRDSLTYWIGRFEQYGGRIVLPKRFNTLLSKPRRLYGYESHDEHGKLVPDYRSPLAVKKKDEPPRTLTMVEEQSAEGRPPLMAPPEGVEIAWQRSGLAIHA